MQQITNQRIAYLDTMRVVATFGVIALHVFCTDYHSTIGSYNWFVAVIVDTLVRWSVPLFVMISGALFLQPSKEVSYRTLLKKQIPRLFIAYVFWGIVYGLIMTARSKMSSCDFKLEAVIPHFHLWYIPMLMGVYMLIPILRKIASEEKMTRTVLGIWMVYLIGCFFDFDNIRQMGILFQSNSIVAYAGYFLFGYYVSSHEITKKQAGWIYLVGISGAIIAVCGNIIPAYAKKIGVETYLNNLGPHVVAMSLALFTFIKQIMPKIERKIIGFVEYVRKDLFGIYLTHALWFMVINISPIRNLCNHLITLPLITIAIFFLSLYTTKLLRAIPVLRKTVE